jgi:peptidyl-prolyl cis-trans isomerase SurA
MNAVFLISLFCFLLFPSVPAKAVVLDRIVAVVNDEVITLSELKQLEVSTLQAEPGAAKRDPKQLLKDLINKKIKLQKAKELGIKVTDEVLEGAIREIVQRNKISRDSLKEKLKGEGITWSDYTHEIRDQIILSRLLNQEIRARIVLLPDEPRQFYEEHKDRFVQPEKKHLLRILLKLPEGTSQEEADAKKKEMDELRQRIISGENFRQIAIQYSEGPQGKKGGDLGYFAAGELREDLNRQVKNLKGGELSPVFQTPEGITLLMVEDIKNSAPIPFEQIKDSVKEAVYQEKLRKKYEAWIKELREKAYIEIKLSSVN